MISVLIADDHVIVREGLKQILAGSEFSVIGEARNGEETIERCRDTDFDILVLDLSMPKGGGLDLIKQIRREKPKLRIVVLSMHEEKQYATRAIKAGALGYVTKDSASAQLLAALRKIASGGAFVSSAVGEQLALEAMADTDTHRHKQLSDREYQVFQMLVVGKSVSEIAAQLGLSIKTISTHKARLLEKMGMTTTAELIHYAIHHSLVDLNPLSGH